MTSSTPVSSVVCSRYAGALVDLSEGAGVVEKVQADLEALLALVSESDEFAAFVNSPLVSREKQSAVIAEMAKKVKLQKLTENFLGVLVENRRLYALAPIVKQFNKIVSARAGHLDVRVETAVALSAKQLKDLQKNIEGALGRGITVEADVKPEILGGMIVTIGSYMVDDSVRRKLDRLGVALKNNSNTTVNLKEVV